MIPLVDQVGDGGLRGPGRERRWRAIFASSGTMKGGLEGAARQTMPLYDYRCNHCGETFEVRQKFADPVLTVHEGCGGELERLISLSALQFKGTGWYVTDYGRNGKKASAGSNGKSETKSDSHGESKSESKAETKSEAKSESKSESQPATKSESKPAPAPAPTSK
jgi:putative FmdB family regulatory protein